MECNLFPFYHKKNPWVQQKIHLTEKYYITFPVDNEDLELVGMLQDMDEKPIDEDSIMGTPAEADKDGEDSDDADYSQAFDDDTILLNPFDRQATTQHYCIFTNFVF